MRGREAAEYPSVKLSLSVRSLFKLRPVRTPPLPLFLPLMPSSHYFYQLPLAWT
jgi:hypothetical protein